MSLRCLCPWWIAAAVLVLAGCQTRLPVDRPEDSSPTPAERRSRWIQAVEAQERPSERVDPFQLDITPDRLREVAHYDPAVSTPGRARSLILVVDTCTAHHTYHHRLR